MTEAAGFPGHAVVPPRALQRRCRHKRCAPTDRARSLPAVLCVPPNARRHVGCSPHMPPRCDRPPGSFIGVPRWPVMSEDKRIHISSHGFKKLAFPL